MKTKKMGTYKKLVLILLAGAAIGGACLRTGTDSRSESGIRLENHPLPVCLAGRQTICGFQTFLDPAAFCGYGDGPRRAGSVRRRWMPSLFPGRPASGFQTAVPDPGAAGPWGAHGSFAGIPAGFSAGRPDSVLYHRAGLPDHAAASEGRIPCALQSAGRGRAGMAAAAWISGRCFHRRYRRRGRTDFCVYRGKVCRRKEAGFGKNRFFYGGALVSA